MEVFDLKVGKIACAFLLLFLISFIQKPCAKIFTFEEICGLLEKKIPKNVKATDYCSQRALILSDVILELSRSGESKIDAVKDLVLKFFMRMIEQYGQPCCNFAESGIIADSLDYFELKDNLGEMEQAYLFLSVTVLLK